MTVVRDNPNDEVGMSPYEAAMAVDVTACVALWRQDIAAQWEGESRESREVFREQMRKIIEEHNDYGRGLVHMLTVALFALARLTETEPDRMIWAFALGDQITTAEGPDDL